MNMNNVTNIKKNLNYKKIKLCLVGDNNTGKTSFVNNIKNKSFNDKYEPTIISDIEVIFKFDDITNLPKTSLGIWDFSGEYQYSYARLEFYSIVDYILIFFDLTNKNSFNNLTNWMIEITENESSSVTKILIGCKSDLNTKIQVSNPDIKNFIKKHNLKYYIDLSNKTKNGFINIINLLK